MVKRKEDTVKPGSKNQLLKPWLYHVWAWILWDLMHPKDLASLLYVCVLHMPSVVPDGTGTGGPLHRKNLWDMMCHCWTIAISPLWFPCVYFWALKQMLE